MAKVEVRGQGSICEILRGFITDNFLPPAGLESFDDDDSFMEKGIIDSTGVLELLEFIEDRFGIRIDDEDITPDNLDSLNKLNSFIHRKQEHVSK